MNKNAMLPDYANSGGKGRSKSLKNTKIGRPRRVNISGIIKRASILLMKLRCNLNTPLTSIIAKQIIIH